MKIARGDLSDPRIIELITVHLRDAREQTAAGSAHALDLKGLEAPNVDFWAIWNGEQLAGVGALKALSADHGEVKLMYTARNMRRAGAAGTMLSHIAEAARQKGMSRLSLETGSWDYFLPAQALYSKHGFVMCEPFADYKPDPNSVFMTLDLRQET